MKVECSDVSAAFNLKKNTIFNTADILAPLNTPYHTTPGPMKSFIKWIADENYMCGPPDHWLIKQRDWSTVVRAVCWAYRDICLVMELESPSTENPHYTVLVLGRAELDDLTEALSAAQERLLSVSSGTLV
jgi:hypothetical protein